MFDPLPALPNNEVFLLKHLIAALGSVEPPPSYVGPLDAFTGSVITGISSSRLLLSSYVGPLIRVRRSSDNAEDNIPAADGLLDSALLSSFIGGGSGFIRSVYDQSGNTCDFGQSTAANQPLCAAGINSKPTMQFDGSDDGLISVANIPALATWWGYIVVKKTALGTGPEVWALVSYLDSVADYRLWECVSAAQTINYNNTNGTSSAIPMLTDTAYSQLLKGSPSSRYAKSSAGDVISDAVENSIIGGFPSTIGYRNDSSPTFITGHIAEAVIVSGTISAEQEAALWADLNAFYGTPIP